MDNLLREAISKSVHDFIVRSARMTILGTLTLPLRLEHVKDIRHLHSIGMISKNDIRDALHERLCKDGISSYKQCSWRTRLDHTTHPYALGYAVIHGRIPYKKAEKLHFDHGETLSEYIEKSRHLLDRAYKMLMEEELPEPKKDVNTSKVAHSGGFCEEHGECFDSH